jgi:hypothetical protein
VAVTGDKEEPEKLMVMAGRAAGACICTGGAGSGTDGIDAAEDDEGGKMGGRAGPAGAA